MSSPLDLLGVTSLLGGEIAKGAIRYINANTTRVATSFLVVPGLYDVSAQMLRRNDDYVAYVLSPGKREDVRGIVGLKASNAYRYTGANSGTTASVGNALCEGWLNRKLLDTRPRPSRMLFSDGERKTSVCKVVLENSSPGEVIKCGEYEKPFTAVSAVFQCAAFAALGAMVYIKDKVGIAVCAANMASNFMVSFAATSDVYRTPSSRPALGVPSGNSIVTDVAGRNICAILGEEGNVQNFLQHEVQVERRTRAKGLLNTVAPVMGFCASIATILATPVMSRPGQYLFAGQLVIGLLSGMVFSSRDGDRMLERLADKYYGETDGQKMAVHTDAVQYTNRATAVAYAVVCTSGRADSIGTLLPSTDGFGNYKKFRALLNDVIGDSNIRHVLAGCNSLDEAINAMSSRFPESAGALYAANASLEEFSRRLHDDVADTNRGNRSKFRIRLIVDVIEALVEHYAIDVPWQRYTSTGLSIDNC